MKKIRRSLSMLLSIAMILTSLYVPAPVYAAEEEAAFMTGGSEEAVEMSEADDQQSQEETELPGVEEAEVDDGSEFEAQAESEEMAVSSTEEDANVIVDLDNVEEEDTSSDEEEEALGTGYELDDAYEKAIGLNESAIFYADDDLTEVVSDTGGNNDRNLVTNPMYFDFDNDPANDADNWYRFGFYSDPQSVAEYDGGGYTYGGEFTYRSLEVGGNVDKAYFEFTVADDSRITVYANSDNNTDTLQIYSVEKDVPGGTKVKTGIADDEYELRATGEALENDDEYIYSREIARVEDDEHTGEYEFFVEADTINGVAVPTTYRLATVNGKWNVNLINIEGVGVNRYAILSHNDSETVEHYVQIKNDSTKYTVDNENKYSYQENDAEAKKGDEITVTVDESVTEDYVLSVYDETGEELLMSVDDYVDEVEEGHVFKFDMPDEDVSLKLVKVGVFKFTYNDDFWIAVSKVTLTKGDTTVTASKAKSGALDSIEPGTTVTIVPKSTTGKNVSMNIIGVEEDDVTFTRDDAQDTAEITGDGVVIDPTEPVVFVMPSRNVRAKVTLEDKTYKIVAAAADDVANVSKYTASGADKGGLVVAADLTDAKKVRPAEVVRVYANDTFADGESTPQSKITSIKYKKLNSNDTYTELNETSVKEDTDGNRYWEFSMPANDIEVATVRKYRVTNGTAANDGIDILANGLALPAYFEANKVVNLKLTKEAGHQRIDSIKYNDGNNDHYFYAEKVKYEYVQKDDESVLMQISEFSIPEMPQSNVVLEKGPVKTTKDVKIDMAPGIDSVEVTMIKNGEAVVNVGLPAELQKFKGPGKGTTVSSATLPGICAADEIVNLTVKNYADKYVVYSGLQVKQGTGAYQDLGDNNTFDTELIGNSNLELTVKPIGTNWNVFTQIDGEDYSSTQSAIDNSEGDAVVLYYGAENPKLFLYGEANASVADSDKRNKIPNGTGLAKISIKPVGDRVINSISLNSAGSDDEVVTVPCAIDYSGRYVANLAAVGGYVVNDATVLSINTASGIYVDVEANSALTDKYTLKYKTQIGNNFSDPIEGIRGKAFAKGDKIWFQAVTNNITDYLITDVEVNEIGTDGKPLGTQRKVTLQEPATYSHGVWEQAWWSFDMGDKPVRISVTATPLYLLHREQDNEDITKGSTISYKLSVPEGITVPAGTSEDRTYFAAVELGNYTNSHMDYIPQGAELTVNMTGAAYDVTPVMEREVSTGVYDYTVADAVPATNGKYTVSMPGQNATLRTKALEVMVFDKPYGSDYYVAAGTNFTIKNFREKDALPENYWRAFFAKGTPVSINLIPKDNVIVSEVKPAASLEIDDLGANVYGFTMPDEYRAIDVITKKAYTFTLNYDTQSHDRLLNSGVKVYKVDYVEDTYYLGEEITASSNKIVNTDTVAIVPEDGCKLERTTVTMGSADLNPIDATVKDEAGNVVADKVYGFNAATPDDYTKLITGNVNAEVTVMPVTKVSVSTRLNAGAVTNGINTTAYGVTAYNIDWIAGSIGLNLHMEDMESGKEYEDGTQITIGAKDGYRIRNVKFEVATVSGNEFYYLKDSVIHSYSFKVNGDTDYYAIDSDQPIGKLVELDLDELKLIVDVVKLNTVTFDVSDVNDSENAKAVVWYSDDCSKLAQTDPYYVKRDDSAVASASMNIAKSDAPKQTRNLSGGAIVTISSNEAYLLNNVTALPVANRRDVRKIADGNYVVTGISGDLTIVVTTEPIYYLTQNPLYASSDSGTYKVEYRSSPLNDWTELPKSIKVALNKGAQVKISPVAGYRIMLVKEKKTPDDGITPSPTLPQMTEENSGIFDYTMPEADVEFTVHTAPLYQVTASANEATKAKFDGVDFTATLSNIYETYASDTVVAGVKKIDSAIMAKEKDRIQVVFDTAPKAEVSENSVGASEIDWTTAEIIISYNDYKTTVVKEGAIVDNTGCDPAWDSATRTLTFVLPSPSNPSDEVKVILSVDKKKYKVYGSHIVPADEGIVSVSDNKTGGYVERFETITYGDTVYVKVVTKDGYELAADTVDELVKAIEVKKLNSDYGPVEVTGLKYEGTKFPVVASDGTAEYYFSFNAPGENISVRGKFRARKYGLTVSENGVTVSKADGSDWLKVADGIKSDRLDFNTSVELKLQSNEDFVRSIAEGITVEAYKYDGTKWVLDTSIGAGGKLSLTAVDVEDAVFNVEAFNMPKYDVLLKAKAQPSVYEVGLDSDTMDLITDGKLKSVKFENKTSKDDLLGTAEVTVISENTTKTLKAFANDQIEITVVEGTGYQAESYIVKTVAVRPIAVSENTVSDNNIFSMPARANLTSLYKDGYKGVTVSITATERVYDIYSDLTNCALTIDGEYEPVDGDLSTPMRVGEAKYGKHLVFTLTPAEGYEFGDPAGQISISANTASANAAPVWKAVNATWTKVEDSLAYKYECDMSASDIVINAKAASYEVLAGEDTKKDGHVSKVIVKVGDAEPAAIFDVSSNKAFMPLPASIGADLEIAPTVADGYEVDKVKLVKFYRAEDGTIVTSKDEEDTKDITDSATGDPVVYTAKMPGKSAPTVSYDGVAVNVTTKARKNRLYIGGSYLDEGNAKVEVSTLSANKAYVSQTLVNGIVRIPTDTPVKVKITPEVDYNLDIDGEEVKAVTLSAGFPEACKWEADENGAVTYTFTMPATDAAMTVDPVDTYYTYFSEEDMSEYVTIHVDPEEGVPAYGDITFTISANRGYSITGVNLISVSDNGIMSTPAIDVFWPDSDSEVMSREITFTMPSGGVLLEVARNARTYNITTEGEYTDILIRNGGNEAAASVAKTGDTVYFKAEPIDDYILESLIVTDTNEEEPFVYYVSQPDKEKYEEYAECDLLSVSENGVYSFVMPADDVIIWASSYKRRYTAQVKAADEKQKIVSINMVDPEVPEEAGYHADTKNTKTDVTYYGISANSILMYSITCADGYTVDEVTVSGNYVTPEVLTADEHEEITVIGFAMPGARVTRGEPVVITVTTKPIKYNVTFNADETSDAYVLENGKKRTVIDAATDSKVAFKVEADPDYEIAYIAVTNTDEEDPVIYYELEADEEEGIDALIPGNKPGEYSFTMKPEELIVNVESVPKRYTAQVKAADEDQKIVSINMIDPDPEAPGFRYVSGNNTPTDVTYYGICAKDNLVYSVDLADGYEVNVVSGNFINSIKPEVVSVEGTAFIYFEMPGEAVTKGEPVVITVTTKPIIYDVSFVADDYSDAYVTVGGKKRTSVDAAMDSTVEFTVDVDADNELFSIKVTSKEDADKVYYALEADEENGVAALDVDEETGNFKFRMVADDVVVNVETTDKLYGVTAYYAFWKEEKAKFDKAEGSDGETVSSNNYMVKLAGIKKGQTAIFEVTPDAGYEVDEEHIVLFDGNFREVTSTEAVVSELTDGKQTISVEMPSEPVGGEIGLMFMTKAHKYDLTIAGDYEGKLETLTVSAGNVAKELTDGTTQVATDAEVVITIVPTVDYNVDNASISCNGISPNDMKIEHAGETGWRFTFTQPANDVTFTVDPVAVLYTVNVTDREAVNYVDVTVDPESASIGTPVNVTLKYKDGYSKGSVVFTDNDGNVLKAGTISSNKLPDGTVTEEELTLNMVSGGINLAIGKKCRSYSVTTRGENATVTTSAKNSKASMEDQVEITAIADDDFTLKSVSVVSASNEEMVYYTYPTNQGLEIPGLLEKKAGSDNTWTYTQMADDVVIVAQTEPIPYTAKVKAAANAEATITAAEGITATGNGTKEVTVADVITGDVLDFTITCTDGYEVDAASIKASVEGTQFVAADNVDGTVSLTLIVPSTPAGNVVTITFDTKPVEYDLTITEVNTTVDGIAAGKVACGTSVEFTAAANADYKLLAEGAVKVLKTADKSDVSAAVGLAKNQSTGKWTFTQPAYEVTVYAAAEMIYYPVNVVDNANVTTVTDVQTAVVGGRVTISADFVPGYVLDKVSVKKISDNTSVAVMNSEDTANNWEYIQVSSGTKVSVTAKPETYVIQTKESMAVISGLNPNADFGSKVEFTVTPSKGYKLVEGSVKILDMAGNDISQRVGLEGDLGTVFEEGHFSYIAPDEPVKISVEAVRNDTYNLTYVMDEETTSIVNAPAVAYEHDPVNLVFATIKGYEVKSVKVVDKNGNNIEVTGKYGIVMPQADVTVTVTTGRKANGETTEEEDFNALVSANYAAMAGAMGNKRFEGPVSVIGSKDDNESALIQNYKKGKVVSLSISENASGKTYVTINAGRKIVGLSRSSYTVVSAYNGTQWTGVSNVKLPKINKKGQMKLKRIKNVPVYSVTVKSPKGYIYIRVIDVKFDPEIKKATVDTNTVSGNGAEAVVLDVTDSVYRSANTLNGVWKIGRNGYVMQAGVRQQIAVNSKVSVYATVNSNGSLTVEPAGAVKGKVKVSYVLNGKTYKTKLDLSNVGIRAKNVPVRERFVKGFEANRNKIVVVKK